MSQDELGQMLGHGKLYIGYIIEIRETNDLNLVELRGFEPLTSAARAPGSARLNSEGTPPHRCLLPPRYVSHQSGHRTFLGACLLNPGEMGFEPLKPVGEPDAANSRIRFDVRVEALRPSFVAPFPRWRSSAGCECGKGRGPPLGELQDIVGEADEAPLVGDLLDAAQEKLTEAARLLDLSEHRLGQLLS